MGAQPSAQVGVRGVVEDLHLFQAGMKRALQASMSLREKTNTQRGSTTKSSRQKNSEFLVGRWAGWSAANQILSYSVQLI